MPNARTQRIGVLLGFAVVAVLGLLGRADCALAGKVGVAAAVKPDAFSEGTEVKLGNSIFYNQRINTSGSGLVQVLLVDGSTFTVGPGSDLVIDKFVYNPDKNQGEIIASFGKGVLRFVGGKISKNDNSVTVRTPAGSLSIRGGMFQLKVNQNQMLASFLFGVELTIKGPNGNQRIFQPGYTYDNGLVRPTRPEDTLFFMRALAGGSHFVIAKNLKKRPRIGTPTKVDIAEITEEGTQDIIRAQLISQKHQIVHTPAPTPPAPPPPPPPTPPDDDIPRVTDLDVPDLTHGPLAARRSDPVQSSNLRNLPTFTGPPKRF